MGSYNMFDFWQDVEAYRNCEEYDEYCEYVVRHDILTENEVDFHNLLNTIINLIVLIGINIYASTNHYSLINYIKILLFGFVILDVALIPIGKVLIWGKRHIDEIGSSMHLAMFKRFPRNKQLDKIKLIKEKIEQLDKKVDFSHHKYRSAIPYYKKNILEARLADYQENLKEVEKLDDVVDKAITNRYNNDVEYVEGVLKKFDAEIPTHSEYIQKKMACISATSKEIIDTCKSEPLVVGRVIETFNIYIPELLSIITYYEKLNKAGKAENEETLKEVFREFESHLNSLKEEIQNNADDAFNMSSSLLLDSLKKKKK